MSNSVKTCPTCNGTGKVVNNIQVKDGSKKTYQEKARCPQCGGTGLVRGN